MRKKRSIMLAALLILGAAGIAWVLLQPGEPVYEGKPLSYWLEGYKPNALLDPRKHDKADEAMRHIGTNAIPTLLQMLRACDSDIKYKLSEWASKQDVIKTERVRASGANGEAESGFEILGPTAKDAVPALIEIYEQNISDRSQDAAVMSLGFIGPAAETAIPLLAMATNNPDWGMRADTAWAIGQIHAAPDLAVPALIQFLHDPVPHVRDNAANALWSFGTDAKPAVPALVEALKDSDIMVYDSAVGLIRQLDPDAAAKAGIGKQ